MLVAQDQGQHTQATELKAVILTYKELVLQQAHPLQVIPTQMQLRHLVVAMVQVALELEVVVLAAVADQQRLQQ
jgi:hypothetical protein